MKLTLFQTIPLPGEDKLERSSTALKGPCSKRSFSCTFFGNKGVNNFAIAPSKVGRFSRRVGPDNAGYYTNHFHVKIGSFYYVA